jgi:hypothetical protein
MPEESLFLRSVMFERRSLAILRTDGIRALCERNGTIGFFVTAEKFIESVCCS